MSARLVVILAILFLQSLARAGEGNLEVYLQVKAGQRGNAPSIEATIVGAPRTTLEKLSLSTVAGGHPVTMPAERVRQYTEGSEPIAVALVISGHEIWIGNDKCEPDEPARHAGVLENLAQAIDKLQLGNVGPRGSVGMVVSYSVGAEVKVSLGDISNITGAALGNQCDYHGKIGTDLVQGITFALAELSKITIARKALIVIGDGGDTNAAAAKLALPQLKRQAQAANIETHAIVYKSAVSSDEDLITTMIPTAKRVNSIAGIAAELDAIIVHIADRYYVTFAGYDALTKTALPWDGRVHELIVRIDQRESDPVTIRLAPRWQSAHPKSWAWLAIALFIGTALVLAIVIIAKRRRVEVRTFVPAPQPQPQPPTKTGVFGAGAEVDGLPVVGWLVALNGSDAYKTQRLKPGLTKIGTSSPADIVVNDAFMSTAHCRITSSPAGFTLLDDGATNGCFVNDRRIQKHDLVDNDVIELGRTVFRFKSIN